MPTSKRSDGRIPSVLVDLAPGTLVCLRGQYDLWRVTKHHGLMNEETGRNAVFASPYMTVWKDAPAVQEMV